MEQRRHRAIGACRRAGRHLDHLPLLCNRAGALARGRGQLWDGVAVGRAQVVEGDDRRAHGPHALDLRVPVRAAAAVAAAREAVPLVPVLGLGLGHHAEGLHHGLGEASQAGLHEIERLCR